MTTTAAKQESAAQEETGPLHILWMNGGLSCDGDSVALTAATQPSIEEIVLGALPGLPRIQEGLDVAFAQRQPRRAPVHHCAQRRPVALAPGGEPQDAPEFVPAHGQALSPE